MRYFLSFLGFAAFLSISLAANNESKPVTVDVYYESLCPDSVRFIVNQLHPTYRNLKEHMDVNYIPYGKAMYTIGTPTTFRCQHGPPECEGNRAQACALHYIQNSDQIEDKQQTMMNIVHCTMSDYNPQNAVPKCVRRAGLGNDAIDTIKEWSDPEQSSFGNDLLVQHGVKTDSLSPRLDFVPTVVVNGERRMDALMNLQSVVCESIPQGKSSICG